jgi:hypothetical protein
MSHSYIFVTAWSNYTLMGDCACMNIEGVRCLCHYYSNVCLAGLLRGQTFKDVRAVVTLGDLR